MGRLKAIFNDKFRNENDKLFEQCSWRVGKRKFVHDFESAVLKKIYYIVEKSLN